jgi:hypothetical protein
VSQIVHITFEKLTGLKGTIEGWFECDPKSIDLQLPLVYRYSRLGHVNFTNGENKVRLYFLKSDPWQWKTNFVEHIKHGVNLLITRIEHGGGVTINSQPPN